MKKMGKFYGTVEGYEDISFVLDGFQCVFFNTDHKTTMPTIIPQKQGFVLGRIIEGGYAYIYSGQELRIYSELTLNTWIYFISKEANVETYKGICFRGGILNKLFFQSSVKLEYADGEELKVKYQDDSLTYSLSNKKIEGTLSIYSTPHERMSAESGESISTNGTNLEIIFKEEKEIQTFAEFFGYILSMCRFMAYRYNIKFEEILLKKADANFTDTYIVNSAAECYIHYEYDHDTDKSMYSCITFNSLEVCVTTLLNSIVDNKPQKPSFNIGFIPENDRKATLITSMQIREVCSALESEMELAKIQVQQEDAFNELVKKLKAVVIEDRDGEHSLTDTKVYDYILGTLRHLSGALADRIENCFLQCQPLMGEWLSRNKIDEIVKYRNTITHGNFMPLDNKLAKTTYILIELVYCCVLKRIGMSDKAIKEIFERHIIS